jgi:hypothetical protein
LTFIGAPVHNAALNQKTAMIHQDDYLRIAFSLVDASRRYQYWRRMALGFAFLAGLEAGALAYLILT